MARKAVNISRPINPLYEGSTMSTTVNCVRMIDTFEPAPTVKSYVTTHIAWMEWTVKPVKGVWSGCSKLRGSCNLSKVFKYKISVELPISTNIHSTVKLEIMGAITTGSYQALI
ncbi:hypothetical protein LIER_21189 [Lithospermum erythrorhizon]|uniref:Uncharacterized protein n=1 Tax=Lithospermum erythrorhizon TaxID=34254 RepID=A0AAV3QQD6_LITER